MMATYIKFRESDGFINQIITSADALEEVSLGVQMGEGYLMVVGNPDLASSFVKLDAAPAITPKGDYTLEALPLPCTLTISDQEFEGGVEYICTEQPTFTFNYPGIYKISVDAGVRYLQKEFEIDYQP